MLLSKLFRISNTFGKRGHVGFTEQIDTLKRIEKAKEACL